MDYNELWDNTAPDIEDLKKYWNEVSGECDGYNNHHEWFAICGIKGEKFTDIVRTIKAAENNGDFSYETNFKEGKNNLYYLECNTAKDFDKQLMNYIIEGCHLTDVITYFEDCWDEPELIEIDKNSCKITWIEIYFDTTKDDNIDYTECNWSVRFEVRDNSTGAVFGFGAGAISPEQAYSILETAKGLEKADDYEESGVDMVSIIENAMEDERDR